MVPKMGMPSRHHRSVNTFLIMTWLVFRCHDLGAPHHVVTATRHRLTPRLHWKPPRHGADHADDAGGCAAGGQRCPRTRAVSDLGAPAAKKGGSPSEEVSLSFFNEPKPWLWWYFGDILVMYIVYSRHHSLLEEFWEFINRQRMELRQPKWGSLSSLHGNFTWQGRITNFNSVVRRWFIYERVRFQCHDIVFYVIFLGVP